MLNSIGELQRRLRSGSPPLSYLQAKAAMAKAVSALILLFFMAFHYVAAQNGSTAAPGGVNFHVGVILDTETLVGNKSLTSIALAVEDFTQRIRAIARGSPCTSGMPVATMFERHLQVTDLHYAVGYIETLHT